MGRVMMSQWHNAYHSSARKGTRGQWHKGRWHEGVWHTSTMHSIAVLSRARWDEGARGRLPREHRPQPQLMHCWTFKGSSRPRVIDAGLKLGRKLGRPSLDSPYNLYKLGRVPFKLGRKLGRPSFSC